MPSVNVNSNRMPTVKAAFKNFFDRNAVISRLHPATKRAMSRAGAFIRSDALRAINRHGGNKPTVNVVDENGKPIMVRGKKGQKLKMKQRASSKPGEAPMSQTGLLKKFLDFEHDESSNSVVVGPSLINLPSGAPETLEYGGTVQMTKRFEQVDDKTIMRLKKPRKETVKIVPRPYMGPALEKNTAAVAEVWRNQLSN